MTPDLAAYDFIVVNSSAGKDSQAMLDVVVRQARALGLLSRVLVVHCDLGRVEWEGTRELAEEHARHYGLRFEVVKRDQDLLDHIAQRGMFPGTATRYCTSDHKRAQVFKLFTQLAKEHRDSGGGHCRILNCMGLRADESPNRAKLSAFERNAPACNGRRTVDNWLPIHSWSEFQVWNQIEHKAGTRVHSAYDLGMPRLSCCFCIYANRDALMLAGKHNRALLSQYVEVESAIGHTFKPNLSLASIQAALNAGEEPQSPQTWAM
jgi:3'-phosphoadenosine 5'-phosphosulfate sulfotransferase (PAPS reductase)/FAD synthetase